MSVMSVTSKGARAYIIHRGWDQQPQPAEMYGVQPAASDTDARPEPIQTLWHAVVVQAFRDAVMLDPPPDWPHRWSTLAASSTANIPTIRDRARTWLLENGNDFAEVCGNAGLDPDMVREAARRMLRDEKSANQANRLFTRERTPIKGRLSPLVRFMRGTGQLFDKR